MTVWERPDLRRRLGTTPTHTLRSRGAPRFRRAAVVGVVCPLSAPASPVVVDAGPLVQSYVHDPGGGSVLLCFRPRTPDWW